VGQSSSRVQRAVVRTWIRYSFFAGSGVGTGWEAWMLRVCEAVSKMRVLAVRGSVGMIVVAAMALQ